MNLKKCKPVYPYPSRNGIAPQSGWTNDPNGWIRSVFPTAHEMLIKRSLQALNLPAFRSVLVVGAGRDPYRHLFMQAKEYVRLDIRPISDTTDIVGDALALPFKASHFDCIFASEVLEHVSDPFRFVREIMQVLKTGGLVIVTTPFLFHGHGDPHDFWRPTLQGLRELFKGFAQVEVQSLGNRVHVISDLVTTAFSPYPVLFPLRIANHLLRVLPVKGGPRFASSAPSVNLALATK
jgi:SAM-dependent methyltransferase